VHAASELITIASSRTRVTNLTGFVCIVISPHGVQRRNMVGRLMVFPNYVFTQ
jgi:hypothetical protein